jgi:N-acetylmuramoyl-L-alanine amidase
VSRGVKLRGCALVVLLVAGGTAAAATVQNVRAWSGPEGTRVVFEVSGPVEHRVFSLANPDRVVIDLPNTSAPVGLTLADPKGAVTGLRTGARPGGELRLVIELNSAAKPKTFLLAPHEQYGHRLVVDLPPAQATPIVRRAPQPSATDRAREVVVVIDAGHGGEDPGASGRGGAREKDVVLAIARKLATEVNNQPGMRAVLVRDGDYFVSHRKRMEIAHAAHADFFLSIHADSYRSADAKGATVYVLSDKGATDEAALLLAQRENASDLIGGVSLADKDQLLARVLLDLSQSAALSASTAAGQRLIRRMSAVTAMRRREVQQAPFLVLKSPDIPSVLVETAYISNPREEASLRSAKYQSAMAVALRQGIVDYFAANPPADSYFASHAPATSTTTQAPAATAIAAAAPVATRPPVRHVISRGETLSGIAERYRVSSASIRRTNSLRTDTLRVGQVLTIPR